MTLRMLIIILFFSVSCFAQSVKDSTVKVKSDTVKTKNVQHNTEDIDVFKMRVFLQYNHIDLSSRSIPTTLNFNPNNFSTSWKENLFSPRKQVEDNIKSLMEEIQKGPEDTTPGWLKWLYGALDIAKYIFVIGLAARSILK